tara:strand:- start:2029 stop:2595 length:567 start_codon:yes stop_codon:yes gene_type:complete
MRILLTVLVLIFSFQLFVKADEIKDYEIEGISIGDSLLNHFTNSRVENSYKNTYPKSNKFVGVEIRLYNSEQYEFVQIHYDNNLTIHSVAGVEFLKNIKECYSKQLKIKDELKSFFKNYEIYEGTEVHREDPSGKSSWRGVEFSLNTGDALIHCTDWSKEFESKGYADSLRIEISTKKFSNFLRYEAY